MSARLQGREPLWVAAALVLVVAFTLPAIHTPFRFDDSDAFEMRTGLLAARGMGFWEYFADQVEVVLTSSRFQPVGVLLTFVPWVFSDAPTLYKLHLLVLWAAGLGLCFAVLRRLGMGIVPALLAIVLAGALSQFHRYHDPLLGYVGVAQWSLILFAGSLLAWLRWERDRERRWLALAIGLWFLCITTYEANVALAAGAVAVVWVVRGRALAAARGSLAFVVPVVAVLAAGMLQRIGNDDLTTGYKPGGGAGQMIETWLVTIVGALPASYALLDPHELMFGFTAAELAGGLWRGAVAALVTGMLLWGLHGAERFSLRGPLALGAGLWLLGGAPLAVAPKYQDELRWGMSYLPGLAQTAGMAMVVAVGFVAIVRALGRRPRLRGVAVVVLAAVAGAGATVTGVANMRVVAHEQPTTQGRALLNDALRRGVLTGLPEPATIVTFARDLNWYPSNFGLSKIAFDGVVADRTGRRDDTRMDRYMAAKPTCAARASWPRRGCAPVLHEGGWLAIGPVSGGGAAVLARAPRGEVLGPRAPAVGLTAYTSGTLAGEPPLVSGVDAALAPWSSEGTTEWRRVGGGDGWSLWRGSFVDAAGAPVVNSIDVAASPVDLLDPPLPDERVRWLGASGVLP